MGEKTKPGFHFKTVDFVSPFVSDELLFLHLQKI